MPRAPLIGLVLLIATALAAPSAQAAPPPTLEGEGFSGTVYDLGSAPSLGVTCDADGGATVRVRFGGGSGPGGPYVGSWRDAFDVKLGPPVPPGERYVRFVSGDLTVDSPTGQVTASLRLDPSVPYPDSNYGGVACDPGSGPPVYYLQVAMRYTATIVTADGVYVDRGRSSLSVSAHNVRHPIYEVLRGFDSDLSTTEQNESALFGIRTPGGSFSSMSANTKRASPFTLFAPATVRKLYAYIDGGGASSGSQTVRAVVYRNAGGPGAYVTRSFDVSVPAGMSARWMPFYLAPPAQLGPGVYWVGLQSGAANGVARFAWNSKPGSRRFNVDPFGDGASDPFGAASVDDQQLSIFAAGSY